MPERGVECPSSKVHLPNKCTAGWDLTKDAELLCAAGAAAI